MLDGLADLDSGFVALDLHRFYRIPDPARELDRRTWPWIRDRAYSLLDFPDSMTLKEATRRV